MASWAAKMRLDASLRPLRETASLVAGLPRSEVLVTVVMPTRDRAGLLPAAIASVLAQTHESWELIVVDDASRDETGDVLAAVEDPRVRCLRMSESTGGSGARNAALRLARGEIVGYLDDDNLMDPGWVRSVVWGFEQCPEAQVLYGALILDDGTLPRVHQPHWDHAHMEHGNLIDQNALAHRAGISDVWFDESLRYGSDWELVHRLTQDRPPLRLPAVAARYRMDAAGRLSDEPPARRAFFELSRRFRATRPLRMIVLGDVYWGPAERRRVAEQAEILPTWSWPQGSHVDFALAGAGLADLDLVLRRARSLNVPVGIVGDHADVRWPVVGVWPGAPGIEEIRSSIDADLAGRVWGLDQVEGA